MRGWPSGLLLSHRPNTTKLIPAAAVYLVAVSMSNTLKDFTVVLGQAEFIVSVKRLKCNYSPWDFI